MPDKGTGKDKGKDSNKDKRTEKGTGKGKDKGKDKGDTRKSDGYGKSSYGKDKPSNKSVPYVATRRITAQNGLDLIPANDHGYWMLNENTGFRQFWSTIYNTWIRGTWEEQHLA